MGDIYNETWHGLWPGQCCQDGCIESETGLGIMHGVPELSAGPLQKYLVDMHNLIQQHGGLDKVREKLVQVRA